ncbi:hypothetical protein H4219_001051 [Mycoemilia scoparia]|uniref:Uncharacterized protein n=1 Tax=Mycoemilia scoparia TaxID=417184 RepID=A0A9W8A964_9FUNG|nr:hypothetical protein H4219_001051 [Mycoemilia scoparia]
MRTAAEKQHTSPAPGQKEREAGEAGAGDIGGTRLNVRACMGEQRRIDQSRQVRQPERGSSVANGHSSGRYDSLSSFVVYRGKVERAPCLVMQRRAEIFPGHGHCVRPHW